MAETYHKVNENVGSGTPIIQVNCGECPEVKVSVPETLINQIRPGSEVAVTFDAMPKQNFTALVTEVGIDSAESGAAFPMTVALQEGCEEIRSGMAADVVFQLETREGQPVIVIPGIAVGEDRNGHFVFALRKDASGAWSAQRRSVEIGEFIGRDIVILSGLNEGEPVVTAGVRRIDDGQQVKLLTSRER